MRVLYACVCMPAYARARACMYACVRACVRACSERACFRAFLRACVRLFLGQVRACVAARERRTCLQRAWRRMSPATAYAPLRAHAQVLAAALCVLCAPAPGLCQEPTFCKKNTW